MCILQLVKQYKSKTLLTFAEYCVFDKNACDINEGYNIHYLYIYVLADRAKSLLERDDA